MQKCLSSVALEALLYNLQNQRVECREGFGCALLLDKDGDQVLQMSEELQSFAGTLGFLVQSLHLPANNIFRETCDCMLYAYVLRSGANLKMILVAKKTYYYYTIQYSPHLHFGVFSYK